VVIFGAVISGVVSGSVGFLLDRLSLLPLDSSQLVVIAVTISGYAGLILLAIYHRGLLHTLGRVASTLRKKEAELEGLRNARTWDFVEMEKVPGKRLVKGEDEEVGVSRRYFPKTPTVKVDFLSSAPVDCFICPDASPSFSSSDKVPWSTAYFPLRQQGVTKWSNTFDAGLGYLYAVARLSEGTTEAEVTIRVSELVPIARNRPVDPRAE